MWRVHRLQFSTYRKVVAEKWMKKACMSHVLLFLFSLKSSTILHISVEFSPINVSRLCFRRMRMRVIYMSAMRNDGPIVDDGAIENARQA